MNKPKQVAHKPDCARMDRSVPYYDRKLDPTCPRCAVRIKTGSWPLSPPRYLR